MVTAGTLNKVHHLNTPERLDFALMSLFDCASEFGWLLQAWAVLSNHYHFVAESPEDPETLPKMLGKLHAAIARELNAQDHTPGRKVIYQYWDRHITYERSYFARLNYVHQNPVRHKLVMKASEYPWCSAAWFERTASPAFFKTVSGFKFDRIKEMDEF